VHTENVDRDLVGERDGWRCGICRKRVDWTLVYPDRMSPSLDHVVPLSEGGEHTYANTRIAHLICNNLRRHHGGNEQLALIG
jgi:5-methylcytosine-specific restriction endonuclease McrA